MIKVADDSLELATRAYIAGEIDMSELTKVIHARAARRVADTLQRIKDRASQRLSL